MWGGGGGLLNAPCLLPRPAAAAAAATPILWDAKHKGDDSVCKTCIPTFNYCECRYFRMYIF